MQRLEVSGAVQPLYGSLGVKGLIKVIIRSESPAFLTQVIPGFLSNSMTNSLTRRIGVLYKPVVGPNQEIPRFFF